MYNLSLLIPNVFLTLYTKNDKDTLSSLGNMMDQLLITLKLLINSPKLGIHRDMYEETNNLLFSKSQQDVVKVKKFGFCGDVDQN